MSAIDGVIRAYSIRFDLEQNHFSLVRDVLFFIHRRVDVHQTTESVRASAPQTSR
jgi:hypothetical protein